MTNFSTSSLLLDGKYGTEFQSCIKWKLSSADFILLPNDQLFYQAANLTYGSRLFLLTEDDSALVCVPNELHPALAVLDQVYVLTHTVTIFFLLLSITFHVWVVREIRGHAVHPVIFHQACLVVFNAAYCLICVKFCHDYTNFTEVLMVISFYSVRAAYCWLNVISFDMWQAFHPTKFLQYCATFSQTSPLRRFVFQALFAFGMPILIIGTCILLRFLQEPELNPFKFAGPIYGNQAQFLFMRGVAVTSMLVNAVFGITIIRNIHRIRRSNSVCTTITGSNKEMIVIYLKVMLLSGVLYFLHIGQSITMNYYPFTAYWLHFD